MKDKFQHFIVCASAVIVCYHLACKWLGPICGITGLIVGSIGAMAWGIWKEKTDKTFDWGDILADVMGVAFGIYLC